MMAAVPWPRGGCPGPIPSVLPACALCWSLGATKGLWPCRAGMLWASRGVEGSLPRGESWAGEDHAERSPPFPPSQED